MRVKLSTMSGYTVVLSGEDVYCSVVFDTLVGVCLCLVLCGPSC